MVDFEKTDLTTIMKIVVVYNIKVLVCQIVAVDLFITLICIILREEN